MEIGDIRRRAGSGDFLLSEYAHEGRQSFTCYFCGGDIAQKKLDIPFRWGGDFMVVRGVPVRVCEQCGEKYFSAKVSANLDQVAQNRAAEKPPRGALATPS